MLVTLLGMFIFLSEEHSEKAFLPMLLTLLAMLTSVSEEHFMNAPEPIRVTPSSITMDFIFGIHDTHGTLGYNSLPE